MSWDEYTKKRVNGKQGTVNGKQETGNRGTPWFQNSLIFSHFLFKPFPVPCSLLPVPCSLFPVPCSLFPVSCSRSLFTIKMDCILSPIYILPDRQDNLRSPKIQRQVERVVL